MVLRLYKLFSHKEIDLCLVDPALVGLADGADEGSLVSVVIDWADSAVRLVHAICAGVLVVDGCVDEHGHRSGSGTPRGGTRPA